MIILGLFFKMQNDLNLCKVEIFKRKIQRNFVFGLSLYRPVTGTNDVTQTQVLEMKGETY